MISLYNTLTRKKEDFVPLKKGHVGLYTCGPTVYHYAHIGNLRSYIFSDLLVRMFKHNSYDVLQVMNITDVGHLTSDADSGEDKMEKGAQREGKTVWDVAQFYTDAFLKDIHSLNICEPNIWCKATDHIKEQIEQVQQIEKEGYTYITEDGVYFDTSKLLDYGALARLKIEELEGGIRVDLGDKKNKSDFALWKFSPKNGPAREMEWDSPWGKGFPGWHIECSAMATKYLGSRFDIHTGGIDHIPVHHTNEIAQAQSALKSELKGKPWVNYWLHGEFLVINEGSQQGKMSKSSGEFLTLSVLQEKGYSPLVYRYFCLSAHYRQQLSFSWDSLDGAKNAYERLKNILESFSLEHSQNNVSSSQLSSQTQSYLDTFTHSINDDLNMPKALAVLWDVVRDKELSNQEKYFLIETMDAVFGLDLLKHDIVEIPKDVEALAHKRQDARASKDWALSDKIRDELLFKGWVISDGKDGYSLKKA